MDDDAFDELTLERKKYGDKNSIWRKMQEELLKWALEEAGYSEKGEIPDISEAAQMIFCGLLIMADWIASNSYYFPLLSVTDDTEPYDNNRSRDAMRYLNLPDGCLMVLRGNRRIFLKRGSILLQIEYRRKCMVL